MKAEKKITNAVDNVARNSFAELISKQVRELEEDVAIIISNAIAENAINNLDNKAASLFTLDLKSKRKLRKMLKFLGQIRENPDRFDVSYVTSCGRLSSAIGRVLKGELESVADALEVKRAYAITRRLRPSNYGGARVRSKSPSPDSVIRAQGRILRGSALINKVLNPVDEQIRNNIVNLTTLRLDKLGMSKSAVIKDVFKSNSEWLNSRKIHAEILNVAEKLSDDITKLGVTDKLGRARITPERLAEKARELLAPVFGKAQNYAKISARMLASVAYHEQIQNVLNVVEEKEFKGGIRSYVFRAVMDSRTSKICRGLNGTVVPAKDTALLTRIKPPLHTNCRSMLIPNLR
jgi:SPP1 gp7 family putative phage head morphogenesis protein